MRTIYLIRHGRTEANARHLYYGSTDVPLSKEGAAELRPIGLDRKNLRFVTSGMLRTEQTLGLLFGAVDHTADPRIREMDFGAFEMKCYEDLKEDPAYQAWISGDNEANPTPGGESGAQMRLRVLAALEDLLAGERDTVVITHGGPIAAIMAHLFPGEGRSRYQWQPQPGHGYAVDETGFRAFP